MKKKVNKLFVLSIFIVLLFVVAACGTGETQQDAAEKIMDETTEENSPDLSSPQGKYIIKVVHGYPVAAQHHKNVEWFVEKVEEGSQGRIEFEVYPNAQLMPIDQELSAIHSGQVDMTYSIGSVTANLEPLFNIFDVPFVFNITPEDTSHAQKFIQSENGGGVIAGALEERGFKLLAIAPTDIFSGPSLTKGSPITTLEELKGLKLRIPGGSIQTKTAEALGFNAQTISGAELVSALSTGVVDGGILPPIYIYDNKLPVKNLTLAPVSWGAVTPLIMSLEKFNSLPPDLQDLLVETGKEFETYALNVVEKSVQEKIKGLETELGIEVVELSDEEYERWKTETQDVWDYFSTLDLRAKALLEEAENLAQ